MSTTLAAPVRVSAEAVGRVRALRLKIDAEDARYTEQAKRLLVPVYARVKRFPRRNFRPEMLAQLEKQWHALPASYRIGCRSTLARDSLHVTDVAISAAKLQHDEWLGPDELSFVIASTSLALTRGHLQATGTITCVVSMHAAARFLQRSASSTTDQDLIDALSLLADHDPSSIELDAGCAIHTTRGSWRGRCIKDDGHAGRRTLSVRTWLPA